MKTNFIILAMLVSALAFTPSLAGGEKAAEIPNEKTKQDIPKSFYESIWDSAKDAWMSVCLTPPKDCKSCDCHLPGDIRRDIRK